MQRYVYTAVVEKADANYSAYLPDIPGCVATGNTAREALQRLTEALKMHLEGMIEDGIEPPPAIAISQQIEADLQPA